MAVQAQYASNALSPDFRSRVQSVGAFDDLPMFHVNHQQQLLAASNNGLPLVPGPFNNAVAAFSHPQSDLTCSGGRKRAREQSASTSTSGRTCSSAGPAAQHDLLALFYRQSLEIDAIIRLQNERLRVGVEQARRRHCRAVISSLEQRVATRLKEKEAELESASRRNAELEERIRHLNAESQIWYTVAKNNEAIVSGLRSTLDQLLLQSSAPAPAPEGCGDSDDAQSCCFQPPEVAGAGAGSGPRKCRACGHKDVSVLLLPCRHLCLCRDCESSADTCPVCHVGRDASLQIFLS